MIFCHACLFVLKIILAMQWPGKLKLCTCVAKRYICEVTEENFEKKVTFGHFNGKNSFFLNQKCQFTEKTCWKPFFIIFFLKMLLSLHKGTKSEELCIGFGKIRQLIWEKKSEIVKTLFSTHFCCYHGNHCMHEWFYGKFCIKTVLF